MKVLGERPSMAKALKWLGFVTAVWVQSISGNNYTFSNYSDSIKSLMNLTQVELNNLSVAKDVGKAFGLLAGLASDKFPTWVLLLIGSLEGFLGYGAQWLVVSNTISPLPYWAMSIFLCMGGNSTTWMNTAILVTCIRNFRKNRGPVSGILKGYVGLSTAIFTDICSALFSDSPSNFLMMLSVIPFMVCLTAMIFLREVPVSSSDSDISEESNYFNVFNFVAVTVAVHLLVHGLLGSKGPVYDIIFSVVLLALLASPLMVPAYIAFKSWDKSSAAKTDVEHHNIDNEPLLLTQEVVRESQIKQDLAVVASVNGNGNGNGEDVKKTQTKPTLGEEHTIFETMKTVDFWVLFVSFLCGVGTGLTVINNMGQMGAALGYTDVSIFVSLLSIMGFFGRIIAGTVSEYFIKKTATPRPVFNAISQVLIAGGYVVMALAIPGSLYIGSIIVGFCYGVRLAITVPTASELFGLKYYGLIYNILILNLPLGSFLFSGLLAGLLYDAEATTTTSGGNECYGAHCYRLCFFTMAAACIVGCALDILMVLRTKALYRRISATKNSRRVLR